MAFSISDFRKKGLADGGSRPNLFSCQFTATPSGLNNLSSTNFTFLCKIATIPPSTLGVVEVPYFGRMVKVPGNRTFDNLSITVLNDENMDIRNDFEFWMGQFNSHEYNDSTYSAGNSGMGTFVITHNNRAMSSGGDKKWEFVNVFPVALGEIGLDWGSNDTIEEFTVDLAYDYWTSDFVS